MKHSLRERRKDVPPVQIVGSKELRRALTGMLSTIRTTDARFLVTVKGKPRAVLMGVEDYVRGVLGEKPDALLIALQKDARTARADRLTTQDIDREIAAVRHAKRPRDGRRRS